LIPTDISMWYPSDQSAGELDVYSISETISLPVFLKKGNYYAGVSILDLRTGLPIDLAFGEPDSNGINILFPMTIK